MKLREPRLEFKGRSVACVPSYLTGPRGAHDCDKLAIKLARDAMEQTDLLALDLEVVRDVLEVNLGTLIGIIASGRVVVVVDPHHVVIILGSRRCHSRASEPRNKLEQHTDKRETRAVTTRVAARLGSSSYPAV